MSAPVTEAHIARARASGYTTDNGVQMAAQFIANNEAAKAERDQLRAEVAWWKNWHEENEKLEDGIAVKVQATIDGLRAEVERLKAASDKEDSMATTTINQRDRAEDAADELASAILGEPIDWPDHDAKWSEALEEAECVHDLKASLSEMIAQSRVDSSVAGIAICNEMGAIARAERAEAELAAERARLADLVADLNDACITLESAENDCDDYAMQNTAFKLNAVRAVLLQYIPNAAMKEGGK